MTQPVPRTLLKWSGARVRTLILFITLTALLGCAPRGRMDFVDGPIPSAKKVRIHIATERNLASINGTQFGQTRSNKLRFGWVDISIPPTHQKGQIEWPGHAKPDPSKHFVVAGGAQLKNLTAFRKQIVGDQTDKSPITVFVHGYNTNNAEATYLLAQVMYDFGNTGTAVLFSWPSAATTTGYVYDRDSVIFARDALERLLSELVLKTDRPVIVMAHSMGTQLTMEALRQISIGGNKAVLQRLEAVALVAPDIDEDVFIRQMARIDPVPKNFNLLVTQQDKALGISALLTGRKRRLGAIKDTSTLEDLPIRVIDLSKTGSGRGLQHNVAFESQAAIKFLKGLVQLATEPIKKLAVVTAGTVADR